MSQIKSNRILLVNNGEYYRGFLRRHLLARNYEIAGEAEDGEQAIKLFKSEQPDLTLLDVNMPNSNGSEILQEILTLNPDAMVIMLTEMGDIATMQQCIERGAFHCLRRDYPLETIFSVIEESLKNFAGIEN